MFLKKLFHLVPSDPLTQGLDHYNQGHFSEAVECFQPLLDHDDPAMRKKAKLYCCESYLQMGDAVSDKDPQRALECYLQASILEPGFADLQNKAGELQMQLDLDAQAENSFKRAVEINPRYFLAQMNLCQLLISQKRLNEALDQLEALDELGPPLYRQKIEEMIAACRRKDVSLAWELVLQIRELSPSNLEVDRQRAMEAIQAGQAQMAVDLLKELLVDHPKFPDLHHMLGLAYGELDRIEDAISEFETALSLHPYYQKARINLALSFMEADRLEEARREFERVIEDDPANPLALGALQEIESLVSLS